MTSKQHPKRKQLWSVYLPKLLSYLTIFLAPILNRSFFAKQHQMGQGDLFFGKIPPPPLRVGSQGPMGFPHKWRFQVRIHPITSQQKKKHFFTCGVMAFMHVQIKISQNSNIQWWKKQQKRGNSLHKPEAHWPSVTWHHPSFNLTRTISPKRVILLLTLQGFAHQRLVLRDINLWTLNFFRTRIECKDRKMQVFLHSNLRGLQFGGQDISHRNLISTSLHQSPRISHTPTIPEIPVSQPTAEPLQNPPWTPYKK